MHLINELVKRYESWIKRRTKTNAIALVKHKEHQERRKLLKKIKANEKAKKGRKLTLGIAR